MFVLFFYSKFLINYIYSLVSRHIWSSWIVPSIRRARVVLLDKCPIITIKQKCNSQPHIWIVGHSFMFPYLLQANHLSEQVLILLMYSSSRHLRIYSLTNVTCTFVVLPNDFHCVLQEAMPEKKTGLGHWLLLSSVWKANRTRIPLTSVMDFGWRRQDLKTIPMRTSSTIIQAILWSMLSIVPLSSIPP